MVNKKGEPTVTVRHYNAEEDCEACENYVIGF